MTPAKLRPRHFVRGDTFAELLIFEKEVNGVAVPMDLTLFSDIRMDLRRGDHRKADLLRSFTLGDGLAIGGADSNELSIDYAAVFTDRVPFGAYYRDIRFVSGGVVQTYLEGMVNVVENITQIPLAP